MNKELQQKMDKLFKSMREKADRVKRQDAIKDVLDSDNVAEIAPDDVAKPSGGVLNKSKKKKMEKCNDKDDCDAE